jgi:2-polyprenyl-3-methyl-5-hydroxy-6-metoxy-1,4-benzoquinol methylase
MSATQHPSLEAQQRFWDWHWQHSGERRTINEWKDRRHEEVCSILRKLPLVQPNIIDLGCGTGWYTERLGRFGSVTGVDLSEEAIAMAKADFPLVTFHAGNLYELPLQAEHYDVVVSQEVVDHVDDREAFLERAEYLLRPGGYLVLACNNKLVMDRLGDESFPPQPPEHIARFLTTRGWKRLVRRRFDLQQIKTLIPIGNGGFLRLINSGKLELALGLLLSRKAVQALKEWAGLGYVIVIVARKRP